VKPRHQQLALGLGAELGRAGADAAALAAERRIPGWNDRAFEAFKAYATIHHFFTTEDVRGSPAALALPEPPDRRAWGAVTRRAVAARLVCHNGYVKAKDPKVHDNAVTLWRSLLWKR
jgi:hypothetical protein